MSLYSKHRLLPVLFFLLLIVLSCINTGTEGEDESNITEATQMAFELTKMAFEMEVSAATNEAMTADQAQPAVSQEAQSAQQAPSAALAISFGAPQQWAPGSTCHKGCYFADVTGDGKADFIAHDNDGLNVVPSTGTGFGPQYSNWSGGPVNCHIACYFADVNGDGRADFIAHDNDGIWVLPAQ